MSMSFEQWLATRQEVESLGDHGIDDVEGAGFLYDGGCYIEKNDLPAESHPAGLYCLTIENVTQCDNDLAKLEKILWDDWAKDIVGGRTPESANAATLTDLVEEFDREVKARNFTHDYDAKYLLREVTAQHGADHADAVYLADFIARQDKAIAILTPELGDAFAKVLQGWLTTVEWKEMRARNVANIGGLCCASHDFCDANMAMDEAFTKLMGRDLIRDDGMSAPDLELVNAAWTYAKAKHLADGVTR